MSSSLSSSPTTLSPGGPTPIAPSPVRPSRAIAAIRGSAIRDLLKVTEQPGVLSLAGGLPATDLIPTERIAEAARRVIVDGTALQYTTSRGVRACRSVVADFVGGEADRILLTHGSQQALSMVALALVDPGDTVVVDDPVYVGALQACQSARATIEALPITADGIDVAALERRLIDGLRPRIVHTVSNFHNPSGMTASAHTRAVLADLAERYGFWIVDDDPYGLLRFDGTAVDPIPGDRVIRLGSVSKILAPALRVGWMQAPAAVIEVIERLKQSADLCGSTFSQLMVADLLGDTAWLDQHVDLLVGEYARRAQALTSALVEQFGDTIEFDAPQGGMFCWARLPGVDTTALLGDAVEAGVAFVPGPAFAVDADLTDRLRLSFASLTPELLDEGVRRLGVAVGCRTS